MRCHRCVGSAIKCVGLPIKVERAIRQQLLGGEASVLLPSLVAAQATASLSGRVTDESGGVLPGVTVTVTQTDTGLSRSVVTEATGEWLVPNLPTGPYRLEVALQGFRTYVQTGLGLQVAANPTINVVLGVGNLEETVSVEASAPLVETPHTYRRCIAFARSIGSSRVA